MELNFNIENQKLTKDEPNFIVQKSNNYLKLFFNFITDDWEDLTKFVIINDSKRKSYQFNYDDEGVIVPSSVLKYNKFKVSVYGADDTTKRITTNEVIIRLHKTGYTTDLSDIVDEEVDVFVDIYNQLDLKANDSDLHAVAKTGDYNDLENIPSEFTPTGHNHSSDEITDLEENIEVEIKQAYQLLANKIRNYGE